MLPFLHIIARSKVYYCYNCSMRSRHIFFLLAAFWAGLIMVLSSRTGAQTPPMPHPVDWVVHSGAFGVLSFLICLGFGDSRRAWIAVILVSFFGASDEIHQHFTPGRSCTASDWLADTTGALAAATGWWLAFRQGQMGTGSRHC